MKISKKILSVILTFILLFTAVPFAFAADEVEYNVGDIIEFGMYPQSKVTDEDLVLKLNAIEKEWISYGYYSGNKSYVSADNDPWADGSGQPSDYMKYKDVILSGSKYRAVTFSSYRKSRTNYISDTSIERTDQYDHGYYINEIYWFKYEPIKWIILNPQSGLIVSKYVIDSQPFSDTVFYYGPQKIDLNPILEYYKDAEQTTYANNYEKSTIRQWLTDDSLETSFYNISFNSNEKQMIKETKIDNSARNAEYSSKDTIDKIFLLSYNDVINTSYGFSGDSSSLSGAVSIYSNSTDYACSQGRTNHQLLRTAGDHSDRVLGIYRNYIAGGYNGVNSLCGIRPALTLDINKITGHEHTYTSVTVQPSCTEKGVITYTCVCGDSFNEDIPTTGHQHTTTINAVAATCTEVGYTGDTYCEDCKTIIENGEAIDKLLHTVAIDKAVAPTCTETGLTEGSHCSVCKTVLTAQEIVNATGHDNVNGKCTNCGHDFTNGCGCKCHSKGFTLFIWKIGNFFRKIFKENEVCGCGVHHW